MFNSVALSTFTGERDDRGWDGWMASPTRWTWVWVNCRSWWWTGRPDVLRFMGSQTAGLDWVTELNWTDDANCTWSAWVLVHGKCSISSKIIIINVVTSLQTYFGKHFFLGLSILVRLPRNRCSFIFFFHIWYQNHWAVSFYFPQMEQVCA